MKNLYFIVLFSANVFGQKQAYVPVFLQDVNNYNGAQFTWSKTYETENFLIIWGDTVGLDPVSFPDQSLAFNPVSIGAFLETQYDEYVNLGFLVDSITSYRISQYKVPIIMNNTWGNDQDAIVGWAEAYTDGFMPVMNIHPLATNGGATLAHEFAHDCQFLVDLDEMSPNNQGGGAFSDAAGIFYETHAEFMASILYPEIAEIGGTDCYPTIMWGDWKNTYRNYPLLYHIFLKYGIDKVNNLWFDQFDNEFPIKTYQRTMNFTLNELNNDLFEFVRRIPVTDFGPWSSYLKQNRVNYENDQWLLPIQSRYTIAEVGLDSNHFKIPYHEAPEECGFNVIPLYPDANAECVKLKFKGHTEANDNAGWRYGFVVADDSNNLILNDGIYSGNEMEIVLPLLSNYKKIYFVVLGASSSYLQIDENHNTWNGYPKHYRYPYDIYLVGAKPEGYQTKEDFRPFLKTTGSYHVNGGGWVSSTSSVGAEVYVSSHAHVLGNSTITGANTRIEETAIVRDAVIGNNVLIKDNAVVDGGTISSTELVVIEDHAISSYNQISESCNLYERADVSNYNLSGSVKVGGDVMVYAQTSCGDNGIYRKLTNYYDNQPLQCDGRDMSHPMNSDVNNDLVPFTLNQLSLQFSNCDLSYSENELDFRVYPNPVSSELLIEANMLISKVDVFSLTGQYLFSQHNVSNSSNLQIDFSTVENGIYLIVINDLKTVKIDVRN